MLLSKYTGSRQALASPEASTEGTLALTEENVEAVLDEVRPYLMSDGGNVELFEIDGLMVKLKLKGACGSCPSSMTTMKMVLVVHRFTYHVGQNGVVFECMW